MASFKIHEDQENIGQLFNKTKEVVTHKRTALGLLNSNCNVGTCKAPFSDAIRKDYGTNISIKENIGCNGLEKKESQAVEKCPRVPFKEIQIDNLEEIQDDSTKESPMTIDLSPAVSLDLVADKNSLSDYTDYIIYKDDIYAYLRQIEVRHKPKAYYMKRQPDVTYAMRSILVDWLVEVGEEYKLHTETLFMAVSYIDRFLSCMAVVRAKLQLLGTAAMFIASKFEEIYPPDVEEFTYITDDTYTKKQVLRMEHLILKVLGFDLSSPTSYTFVIHVCVTAKLTRKIMFLAAYLCELSLLEGDPYLEFNPSIIGSSAIAIARHCLGYVDIWPSSLVNESGYTLLQLAPVVGHLSKTHAKAFQLQQGAIKEKYKTAKYHEVSQVPAKRLIIRE